MQVALDGFTKEFLPDESEDLGAEHFSDDATVRHDVAVEVGKKLDEGREGLSVSRATIGGRAHNELIL